jgi:hypothetical protein
MGVLKQAWDYLFTPDQGTQGHFKLGNLVHGSRYLTAAGDPLGLPRVPKHLLRPAFAASLLIGSAWCFIGDKKENSLNPQTGMALAFLAYGTFAAQNALYRKWKWSSNDYEMLSYVLGQKSMIDTKPDDGLSTPDSIYEMAEKLYEIGGGRPLMLQAAAVAGGMALTAAYPVIAPLTLFLGTGLHVFGTNYLHTRYVLKRIVDEDWVVLNHPPAAPQGQEKGAALAAPSLS